LRELQQQAGFHLGAIFLENGRYRLVSLGDALDAACKEFLMISGKDIQENGHQGYDFIPHLNSVVKEVYAALASIPTPPSLDFLCVALRDAGIKADYRTHEAGHYCRPI